MPLQKSITSTTSTYKFLGNTFPQLQGAFPKSKKMQFSKFWNKISHFPKNLIKKKNSLSRFAHVNPRRRSVRPLGYRVVHPDALRVNLHSRALLFGHLGIFCALEINKREASRTSRLNIQVIDAK